MCGLMMLFFPCSGMAMKAIMRADGKMGRTMVKVLSSTLIKVRTEAHM
jgi:hypothetical protein